MASSVPKTLAICAALLLVSLLAFEPLVQAQMENEGGPRRTLLQKSNMDCGSLCTGRCSQSSRPNLCKRACGTCCARCNCVPAGTSGGEKVCPCYFNQTTHGGKRKCP